MFFSLRKTKGFLKLIGKRLAYIEVRRCYKLVFFFLSSAFFSALCHSSLIGGWLPFVTIPLGVLAIIYIVTAVRNCDYSYDWKIITSLVLASLGLVLGLASLIVFPKPFIVS